MDIFKANHSFPKIWPLVCKNARYPTIKPLQAQDEALLLTATVQDTNALRWWLLGLGDQVEVLEPAELRNYFADIAANMASAYTS